MSMPNPTERVSTFIFYCRWISYIYRGYDDKKQKEERVKANPTIRDSLWKIETDFLGQVVKKKIHSN